jgi:hypothetical protein
MVGLIIPLHIFSVSCRYILYKVFNKKLQNIQVKFIFIYILIIFILINKMHLELNRIHEVSAIIKYNVTYIIKFTVIEMHGNK